MAILSPICPTSVKKIMRNNLAKISLKVMRSFGKSRPASQPIESKGDTCTKDDYTRTEETDCIAKGGDNHARSEWSGRTGPLQVPKGCERQRLALYPGGNRQGQ